MSEVTNVLHNIDIELNKVNNVESKIIRIETERESTTYKNDTKVDLVSSLKESITKENIDIVKKYAVPFIIMGLDLFEKLYATSVQGYCNSAIGNNDDFYYIESYYIRISILSFFTLLIMSSIDWVKGYLETWLIKPEMIKLLEKYNCGRTGKGDFLLILLVIIEIVEAGLLFTTSFYGCRQGGIVGKEKAFAAG